MEAEPPGQPGRQILVPVAAGLRAGRVFIPGNAGGPGRSDIFPLRALRGEFPLSDPPTPPEKRTGKREERTQHRRTSAGKQ